MKSQSKIWVYVLNMGRMTYVPKMHPFLHSPLQEPWLAISHINTYIVSLNLGYINPIQNSIHLRK